MRNAGVAVAVAFALDADSVGLERRGSLVVTLCRVGFVRSPGVRCNALPGVGDLQCWLKGESALCL